MANTWMKKYLSPMLDKKIVKVGVTKDGFPFFVLDDGTKIEVSQDEECNGPGFLTGLPRPE